MLALDWAQKMLCNIVPNRRTASPDFFWWFRTRRLLAPSKFVWLRTKEMHAVTKLSVWYKLPISNTVYPKTIDAFPIACVAWVFVGSNLLAVPLPSPAFVYFARPTKTAMLRRLLFQKYKLELTTGIHAHSNENVAWKVNSHFFILYRDYSNSLTLSNASELFWSWTSINHIQIYKEKKNFVIACFRLSPAWALIQ